MFPETNDLQNYPMKVLIYFQKADTDKTPLEKHFKCNKPANECIYCAGSPNTHMH